MTPKHQALTPIHLKDSIYFKHKIYFFFILHRYFYKSFPQLFYYLSQLTNFTHFYTLFVALSLSLYHIFLFVALSSLSLSLYPLSPSRSISLTHLSPSRSQAPIHSSDHKHRSTAQFSLAPIHKHRSP